MAEEKKKKEKWVLGEVPTQTEQVFIDTEGEEGKNVYNDKMLLVQIANDIAEIKKSID